MNKKPLLVLFIGAAFTLAGCSASEQDSSSVDNTADSHYYLTGDLSLSNGSSIELSKKDGAYSISGVTLRRGDSFLIQKDNSSAVSYENLTNNNGFANGKNGYIRVLNEGVYDISLKEGTTPELTLTKTGSSYQNVKLVLSDGTSSNFTMNEDFTYTLSNVNLLYRENFYIALDDEKLSFIDYNYNDLYYEALRFGEDKVSVIEKGTFQFSLNFANQNALTITSPNVKAPNTIPTDAESYSKLLETFDHQFVNGGREFTMTETVTDSEDKVTKKFYKESMSSKEHYCYEKDGEAENAEITERSYVLTDTNYYEIMLYTNSTSASKLTGYLLGEAPAKEATDDTSTMVKLDKSYITEENAKNNLKTMASTSTTLVNSYLKNVIAIKHLSSHTTSDDAAYLKSLEIEAGYAGTIGDTVTLTAKNIEKYYATYGTSQAIKNTITLTVDNDGHLASGTVLVETYSSSNASNIFDNSTDKNIKDSATPTETKKYEFSFTYGDQTNVEYKLDPAKYVLNEIVVAPKEMKNGDIFSFSPVESYPLEALDKSNLQIIEYDSKYFDKGNSAFTAKKAGETSVYVGNLYSDIREKLDVTITYTESTRIDLKINDNSYTTITSYQPVERYVGDEEEFIASVSPSTADPAITVASSDETKVKVESLAEPAAQRGQSKITFKLKMLAETTTNVTITVKSYNTPNVSATFSVKVLKALTMDDFVGTYYFGYKPSSSYDFYSLNVTSSGDAVFTNETDSVEYHFGAKVNGGTLLLNESSDLSSFSAKISSPKTITGQTLKSVLVTSCISTAGTNLVTEAYSRASSGICMTESWNVMETFAKATDSSASATWEVLSLTNNNNYATSSYAPATNVKVIYADSDGTSNELKFRWEPPTSSYSSSSIDKDSVELNGTNIYHWSLNCSVSISDNVLSFTIERTYDPYKINLSFTFTAVSE